MGDGMAYRRGGSRIAEVVLNGGNGTISEISNCPSVCLGYIFSLDSPVLHIRKLASASQFLTIQQCNPILNPHYPQPCLPPELLQLNK